MTALILTILVALVARMSTAFFTPPIPSIPPDQLITSPISCLSDIECPPDQYCKPDASSFGDAAQLIFARPAQRITTCAQRFPEGSRCFPMGLRVCAVGTSCAFTDDVDPSPPTCIRRASLGARCAISATDPCQEGLKCQGEDKPKCLPFTSGFEGESCRVGCQVQQGFYCRSNFDRCTTRRPPGGECGVEANNFECEGFCVTSHHGYLQKPGICQRLQEAGEKCNTNLQCNTVPFPLRTPRTVDLLCNRPSGYIGVCVLETDLVRQLGAPCNPVNDTCDARRGLSCGRVYQEFKCVQRAAAPAQRFHFCTPNSPLSTCPPDMFGNPRECRRALSMTKNKYEGTFGCRSRRQVVPLGSPCNEREYVICQRGAVCAETPAVAGFSQPRFHLATCMRVLPIGAPCTDLLRFTCEKGSFCVNKTCQRAESPPTVPISFVSTSGDCSKLPCIPGRVCMNNSFNHNRKTCRLPVVEVGLWQPCYEAAQLEIKCKDGLHCSRNFVGKGLSVCRPKRRIGGLCVNDNSCIGDLKCNPSFDISFREPVERRCFNASLSLNLGDSCQPHPRRDEPRCVSQVETAPAQRVLKAFPLSCLPSTLGNGSYVCQVVAGLFEQCSKKENIGCNPKELVCSEFDVCIPAPKVKNTTT